jgi:hypothetical protein
MIELATATKLGKLLRMLGSNQQGEALNTVEAIKRTLQNVGSDLNEFADRLSNDHDPNLKFSDADMQVVYNEAYNDGFDAGKIAGRKENQGFHNVGNGSDWHSMVIECRDHRRLRGSREREFLDGLLTSAAVSWARNSKRGSTISMIGPRSKDIMPLDRKLNLDSAGPQRETALRQRFCQPDRSAMA